MLKIIFWFFKEYFILISYHYVFKYNGGLVLGFNFALKLNALYNISVSFYKKAADSANHRHNDVIIRK